MVQNINLYSIARETMENITISNQTFRETPLTALSRDTLRKLSILLNNLKIIHSDKGYERDWRGLATLTEQRSLYDVNNVDDPFGRVIKLWCENKPDTATIGNLLTFLGLIDRWHVIEDLEDNFLQDFLNFQNSNQQQAQDSNTAADQINVAELHSNTKQDTCAKSDSLDGPTVPESFSYESESKVLTSNDVSCYQQGLPLIKYDAFLLYADVDYDYALEIVVKLQNNPLYNFKFCLKDDLLFGIPFEHIALMELIRERCKFLIVILTEEFTKSPENRFFVNYAQALQIKQEIRKVIPLMYEDRVEVPANLAMFSRMRYNPHRTDLYWSKLADSMQQLRLSEGLPTFSATFQRSIVNGRRQPKNLDIETQKLQPKLDARIIKSDSSPSTKKRAVRKRRTVIKSNRFKLKESTLTEFENSSSVSSSCSSKETRGIFRKLFCCY